MSNGACVGVAWDGYALCKPIVMQHVMPLVLYSVNAHMELASFYGSGGLGNALISYYISNSH